MPAQLNAEPSVRSKLDPGVDSLDHSPTGSSPRSSQTVGADGSPVDFTGATSLQTKFCEQGPVQCGHSRIELDSDQLCGWGTLKPRALQIFNTPHWVLLFLSLASFLQGFLIHGLINTAITSIERRFDLSSSQSGFIISSFDISCCVCLPFVSYFGGNGHKPRWLGWGVGVMGLGSLVFALPHFTSPSYQVTVQEESNLCSSNTTDFSGNKSSDGLSGYFYIFVLGQLLHGFGATPLFTLGFTFLDDSVKSDNSPLFMGIYYTAAMFGPSIGFLVGGFFLRIYSEITMETDLTPASPLWVGAWWIGFILVGIVSLPVAFFILGYPKRLPGSRDFAPSSLPDTHQHQDGSCQTESNPEFGKTLRDMPKSLLLLLKNPSFMCLSLATAALATVRAMLGTFTPKYFESQFDFSASEASLIFGAMLTPVTVGGTFLGSFFIKRLKLQNRGMTRLCIACCFVGLLLSFMFFIECPTAAMAGVTLPYSSGQHVSEKVLKHQTILGVNSSSLDPLWAQCNSRCSCERALYSPVCGEDDVVYFSSCFAGCSNVTDRGGEMFTDCGCVLGGNGTAVKGKCAVSCPLTALFMTLFTISSFLQVILTTPALTATLRSVPEQQKSFALGIQWIIVRTLGTIPGPIIFGSLLDQACLLKQSQDQASCSLYENSELSRFTFILCSLYEALCTVFFLFALFFCKHPPASASTNHETDLQSKTSPGDGDDRQTQL